MKKTCTIAGNKYTWETAEYFLAIIANYPNFKIGSDFSIGNHFTADNDFTAGNRFTAGNHFKCLLPLTVKRCMSTNGLYTYHSAALIAEQGDYVVLGCHCRLVSEWEADFWNNPSEFPNNGSQKSTDRWRAFNLHKLTISQYK